MGEPFFSDAVSALSCYPDGCVCWLFCLQGSEASPDPEQDCTTSLHHRCPHPPLTGPLCHSPAAMCQLLGKAQQSVCPCAETVWEPLPLLAHSACSSLVLRLGRLWGGGFGLKGESSM